jgi:heme/copper-type cytochrome/quinol oxidase subunit 2
VRVPPIGVILAVASAVALVAAGVTAKQPPPDYIVTAVNYRFRDAHPTPPLQQGEDLVVKNAADNVHNVTIPAIGISQDIAPGAEIRFPDIASSLAKPGRYTFFCQYHHDRGMTGVIVVAGSD